MKGTYEDLKMFQETRSLVREIYQLTNKDEFRKDFGFRDQIRRAGISIISNMAEGHERNSNKEFIQFLGYSKGSCGEVRAQLMIASDIGYIESDDFMKLYNKTIHISSMIYKYIEYLQTLPSD